MNSERIFKDSVIRIRKIKKTIINATRMEFYGVKLV